MKIKMLMMLFVITATTTFAQNTDSLKAVYIKTITERADKIVAVLKIDKAAKAEKVRNIIRDQYSDLNDIYTVRDQHIKTIKATEQDKAKRDTALAVEARSVATQLAKLHKKFVSKLGANLTEDQVVQVKDGLTYGVVPLTYRAYQEEILTLTEEQKKQILAWLIEAREHAMDAESSDKKHAWFGKYKGRINNYLSAAGYDLKKEGQEWDKRRKAAAGKAN